jgi:hypothetical protein
VVPRDDVVTGATRARRFFGSRRTRRHRPVCTSVNARAPERETPDPWGEASS